jgi:uncharacterized membrane protein YcfT
MHLLVLPLSLPLSRFPLSFFLYSAIFRTETYFHIYIYIMTLFIDLNPYKNGSLNRVHMFLHTTYSTNER